MPITDPAAVRFCNEKVRPLADRLAQTYRAAQGLVDEWNALGLSALIPNDASVVVDGSATDGRPALTGAKATNVVTRAIEMIADMEANSKAKLNTVLAAAVNTR